MVAATERELAGADGAAVLACGLGPVEAAAATEVVPNCPRYIHEYRLVARSRFVPKSECETPVPKWKQSEWAHDVLPEGDPAADPSREVIARG